MASTNPETGTPYTPEQIEEARIITEAANKARMERLSAEAEKAAADRAARDTKVAAIARMPELEAVRAAIVALPSEAIVEHVELSHIVSMAARLQTAFPAVPAA